MVECMDKLQMGFTYYFDYDYWGLLEQLPCKTACTIMYCTLWYQYSSIIIIITSLLLGIVMWDVFKDDLFLVLQTLWSKYHNFHLHNEKPESQRHKRLVQVHTNWIQLCLPWERVFFVMSGGSEYALFSRGDRRTYGMNLSVVHQDFVF